MDGIKRTDLVMANPVAKLPNRPDQAERSNPGRGNVSRSELGRGAAVLPGGPVQAPDPVTVPETPASAAPTPAVKVRQLEFRGLVKDMAAAPPVDMSRVMALKAQIASGTFTIDPSRVADAMLGSLRAA